MPTADAPVLKAPFPYAGGKARVAAQVWDRFGDVDNYVEPFAGSLAVLLRRPADHFRSGYRVETVNDLNHYLVNFWRAVSADPASVARWADWPVTEADLHARHKWLVRSREAAEFRERMRTDPHHFDAKVAGWWVWGACCWIGSGWCADAAEPAAQIDDLSGGFGKGTGVASGRGLAAKVPDLTSGGCGDAATATLTDKLPELSSGMGRGDAASHLSEQLPHMDAGGRGRHGRPQLADAFDIGRGVNGGGNQSQQIPYLADSVTGVVTRWDIGTCDARRAWLTGWMQRLADRLRLVRTCYGHWSRVCDSDSTLTRLGTTGVFLDPPYPARSVCGKKSRDANLYATDRGADLDALRDEVLDWCRRWGTNPQIRVAVCGYEGDGYEPLTADGWTETAWSASGGYGNQRKKGGGKSANADRERIWWSPHCLSPDAAPTLFDGIAADGEGRAHD